MRYLTNHTKDEHICMYEKLFDKKEDTVCRTPYIKQLMMEQVSKPPKDIFPSTQFTMSLRAHLTL